MAKKTIIWITALFLMVSASFSLSAQSVKIGFAWAGKSGMANRVTAGFDKRIKEIAPDMQIEYNKNLPDVNALAKVIANYQRSKKGMVILRSNGAQHLGKNTPSIPTFIGGCNHPGQLGAVKNLGSPEGNITGVTYFLPVETQFDIFKAILPNMDSLVLLTNEKNPSSVVDLEETKQMCNKLGLKCVFEASPDKKQLFNTVKKYSGKVSTFIIGNQAEVFDFTEQIVKLAGNTPVLSYSSTPVKKGALGGFVADDMKLGMMLAESVVDVMKKGKSIKLVPIKVDPNPKFFVNVKTAEKLGIQIPYEVLEMADLIQ